jgi:tRNA threonylcarbamoyladenosine biosynthesis protein TsaB
MSYILNIDTSGNYTGICLAENGVPKQTIMRNSEYGKQISVHVLISEILKQSGISISNLSAIAIMEGPGSYTGLRVGMAAAKGMCFSLDIPMVTAGTLMVMAKAAIEAYTQPGNKLFCPMIDARRMEVYTAIYNPNLEEFLQPCNKILNESTFKEFILNKEMLFFGSGAEKWKKLMPEAQLIFLENVNIVNTLASISYEKYRYNVYADLIHSQPTYLKEFYEGK